MFISNYLYQQFLLLSKDIVIKSISINVIFTGFSSINYRDQNY